MLFWKTWKGKLIEVVCAWVEVLEWNLGFFAEEESDEWGGERGGDEAMGTALCCYKHPSLWLQRTLFAARSLSFRIPRHLHHQSDLLSISNLFIFLSFYPHFLLVVFFSFIFFVLICIWRTKDIVDFKIWKKNMKQKQNYIGIVLT